MLNNSRDSFRSQIDRIVSKNTQGSGSRSSGSRSAGYPAWLQREIAEKKILAQQEAAKVAIVAERAAGLVRATTQEAARILLEHSVQPDTRILFSNKKTLGIFRQETRAWVVHYKEVQTTPEQSHDYDFPATIVTGSGLAFDEEGSIIDLSFPRGTGRLVEDPMDIASMANISISSNLDPETIKINQWQGKLARFVGDAITRKLHS